MKKIILLPDLGEGIEKVDVSEIPVKIGDKINNDTVIIILESDKATMEIPSEYYGTITDIFVSNNSTLSSGDKILEIETKISKSTPQKKVDEKPKKTEKQVSINKTEINNSYRLQNKSSTKDKLIASPGVRKICRELGIDINCIISSSNDGRISRSDLYSYIRKQMDSFRPISEPLISIENELKYGDLEQVKINKIKKITGQSMLSSWTSIPQVTQFDEVDITEIEHYRNYIKKKGSIKITLLPFIIKIIEKALLYHPYFNSSIIPEKETIILKKYFNIGIAVATKNGLIVPNIKNVENLNIIEINQELRRIVDLTRNGKITPTLIAGSTFTISNQGGIGGTNFTPIVNHPQSAILGISKAKWKNIIDSKTMKSSNRLIMPISLSYDHRVADGAEAAAFTSFFSKLFLDKENFNLEK